MGIHGLLAKISKNYFLKYRKATLFQGGVFHVDALNLMSNVIYSVKPVGRTGILKDFERKLKGVTYSLLRYNPKSITMYFDACVPYKKLPLRAARRHRKLKELDSFRQVVLPADLMARYLFKHHPKIKIVYTAMDAEDEIMQEIYEDDSPDHHFVFSSDSDCFTFQMPSERLVDIVPVVGRSLESKGAKTVDISKVIQKGAVKDIYRREMPITRTGTAVVADRPMRSVMELVNLARASGKFIANTPLLYNPANISPYDMGVKLRRCGYGATIEKFFPGKHPTVREETQEGPKLVTNELDPILGQDLKLVTQAVGSIPVSIYLENELKLLRKKYDITDAEIRALGKYVRDLGRRKDVEAESTLHERIPVLYPLLMAFLVSMEQFRMASGLPSVSRKVLWNTSPYELSSYL